MILIAVVGLVLIVWGAMSLAKGAKAAQGVLEETMDALSAPKPPDSGLNPDGSSKAIEYTLYWLVAGLGFGWLYWAFFS